MNKEENFINTLFEKTEESEAIKPQTTEIIKMPMSSIVPNFKNPYKCREEDMKPLEDSIRENGIIQPLMVRKDDKADVYEIISGHRRYLAATRLKLTEVPVVVLDITKEEADIILVDSNLYREHILPSEKAFAYKMKMDAIKRQGKRTDLTSDQVGPKLSADEISDTDSASQVKRYIRLTNLIPRLLALVDSGKIALGPAVELSYLNQGHQNFLAEAIEKELATPSLAQAQKLKKLAQEGKLDVGTILAENILFSVHFKHKFKKQSIRSENSNKVNNFLRCQIGIYKQIYQSFVQLFCSVPNISINPFCSILFCSTKKVFANTQVLYFFFGFTFINQLDDFLHFYEPKGLRNQSGTIFFLYHQITLFLRHCYFNRYNISIIVYQLCCPIKRTCHLSSGKTSIISSTVQFRALHILARVSVVTASSLPSLRIVYFVSSAVSCKSFFFISLSSKICHSFLYVTAICVLPFIGLIKEYSYACISIAYFSLIFNTITAISHFFAFRQSRYQLFIILKKRCDCTSTT